MKYCWKKVVKWLLFSEPVSYVYVIIVIILSFLGHFLSFSIQIYFVTLLNPSLPPSQPHVICHYNHMSHVTIIACNHSIAIALPIPPMIVTVKPYYQHHLSYPHCIYKLMDYNPHGCTPVIPLAYMCHSQFLPIIYWLYHTQLIYSVHVHLGN
jgi:hypothetical protein